MYVEVALKIPGFKCFTYKLHPTLESLDVGHRVIVRFRNKKEIGIICNKDNIEYSGKANTILETNDSINLFTEELIILSKRLSKYYFTSLGITMDTIIRGMSEPKRNIKQLTTPSIKQKDLKFSDRKILNKINNSLSINKKTLIIDELKNPDSYICLIEDLISKNIPVVLLMPDQRYLEYWKKRLYYLNPAIISGNMSKIKKFQNWLNVKNGNAKIVIGTRQACFSPFQKKGVFIIFDEESSFYNEEIGLHYNAVDVCNIRSNISDWKILYSTPTPSLKTYSQAEDKIFNLYQQTVDKKRLFIKKLLQYNIKHDSSFSELIHRSKKLEHNEYAVLLSSVSGYIKRVRCGNCGQLYKCPFCGNLLSYDKKNILCNNCKKNISDDFKCHVCNEFSPRFSEFGREGLKTVCENLLDNKDQVQLLKNSSDEIKNGVKIIISPFNIYNPLTKDCKILALFYPDRFLYGDSLSEMETFYQILRRGFLFTTRNDKRTLFVFFKQLDQSETQEMDWIKNSDDKGDLFFYNKEIKTRKKFRVPPFTSPFTLILKSSKQDVLLKEITDLSDIFSEIKEKTNYNAFPDFPGILSNKGKTFFSKTIFYLDTKHSQIFENMLFEFISKYSGRIKISVSRETP